MHGPINLKLLIYLTENLPSSTSTYLSIRYDTKAITNCDLPEVNVEDEDCDGDGQRD